jgi:hypothetical protein
VIGGVEGGRRRWPKLCGGREMKETVREDIVEMEYADIFPTNYHLEGYFFANEQRGRGGDKSIYW